MRTERFAEGITLYLANCHDVLPTLGKVDAVVTDPPYGVEWDTDYRFSPKNSSVAEAAAKLPRGRYGPIIGDDKQFDPSPFLGLGHCIFFGANNFSNRLPKGSLLIWDKRDNSGNSFMSAGEVAWLSSGQSVRFFTHCWQGFSRSSENSEHYHPTQKPVELMKWCIAQLPERPKTILDPFMGSGTTGIAAIKMGIAFVGIEMDEKYFAIACKRLDNTSRQRDLFVDVKPMEFEQQQLEWSDMWAKPFDRPELLG